MYIRKNIKGSYPTLIANVYNQKTASSGSWTNADSGIQNTPLSFLRGGYYYYSNDNLDSRGSYGRYWEGKTNSETNARGLNFRSTNLNPQANDDKGNGFPIRCVVR